MNRRFSIVRLPVVSMACFLAACQAGPDHVPPPPPPAIEASSAAAVALAPDWWRQLQDPVLDGLLAQVRAASPQIGVARARLQEARALAGMADANGRPQLDVGAAATRSRRSEFDAAGPGPQGASHHFQVGFDAVWELDLFGAAARERQARAADLAVAELNLEDLRLSLSVETVRCYLGLRAELEREQIQHEMVAALRLLSDLASAKVRGGLSPAMDLHRARSLLAVENAKLPRMEAAQAALMHRLGVLCAESPATLSARMATLAPGSGIVLETPRQVDGSILRRRPDLAAAERRIAADCARIGVASAALYPKITLMGSLGLAAAYPQDLGDSGAGYWSFGPALSWPVFQWGRLQAQVDAAEARHEESLQNYIHMVLVAMEEAQNALVRGQHAQASAAGLAEALREQEDADHLALRQYEAGTIDFSQVIEIRRTLLDLRRQFCDVREEQSQHSLALIKALGGGWQAPQP